MTNFLFLVFVCIKLINFRHVFLGYEFIFVFCTLGTGGVLSHSQVLLLLQFLHVYEGQTTSQAKATLENR